MSAQPDQRRKLELDDYKKMRLYLDQNYTIREVASTFAVSTKYVKRVAQGKFTFLADGSTTFSAAPDDSTIVPLPPVLETCSGCGYSYGQSGLDQHYQIYTSGFTKELECAILIGR